MTLRHEFSLLRQCLAEACQEGLEITHAHHVDAATGARGETRFVFAAIALERRELLLHLDQVALGGADPFSPFALGTRRGLLDYVETVGTFHAGAFWSGGALANSWRSALTASWCPTRWSMGCTRNFCMAGHNSMAASMRGSLPFW